MKHVHTSIARGKLFKPLLNTPSLQAAMMTLKQSRSATPSSITSISSRSPPEQIPSGQCSHSARTNSYAPGSDSSFRLISLSARNRARLSPYT